MSPITFTGNGYGAEPCPGCGQKPEPGEIRLTVPGIWRVWHLECYDPNAALCPWCRDEHASPYDGRCML